MRSAPASRRNCRFFSLTPVRVSSLVASPTAYPPTAFTACISKPPSPKPTNSSPVQLFFVRIWFNTSCFSQGEPSSRAPYIPRSKYLVIPSRSHSDCNRRSSVPLARQRDTPFSFNKWIKPRNPGVRTSSIPIFPDSSALYFSVTNLSNSTSY